VGQAVDTVRVVVTWRCNRVCGYCCNRKPAVRAAFRPARLHEVDWPAYRIVCITGGEPLLYPERIERVARLASPRSYVVLYTNGLLLDRSGAESLERAGVHALNVSLHDPRTFREQYAATRRAVRGTGLRVQFYVWNGHSHLVSTWPGTWRFWVVDNCDRSNEDRVVLADWLEEV